MLEVAAELHQCRLHAARAGSIARQQHGSDVGVRGLGAVPKRDRFLDLEVDGHLAVAHSAAVLDRHELEESIDLTGPPQQLGFGERCGTEALERRAHPCGGRRRGLARRERALREPCCQAVDVARRRAAALRDERRPDDSPVALGERSRLRALLGKARRGRLADRGQRASQPAVVRVEEVGADSGRRFTRSRVTRCKGVEGEGRIFGGTGEARRRTELADEQPAARAVDLTAAGSDRRLVERGGEHGCPDCRPRGRESPRVAGRDGQLGATQPGAGDAELRGSRRERRLHGLRCGLHGRRSSLRLVQHERRLGLDERGAEPVRLDRRWARRRGVSRGDEREACPHQGGESGDVPHRYCAIFTLRRAAAWVTWPATATACSCAARPRTSACRGVNRLPARSLARRSATKARSSAS